MFGTTLRMTIMSGMGPGPHDISANPQFVNSASHDYHLQASSPCVDAGNPDPRFDDLDDTRSDVGRFHRLQGLPLPININFANFGVGNLLIDPNPTIFWSYLDTVPSLQSLYQIEVGIDQDWSIAEMWEERPGQFV